MQEGNLTHTILALVAAHEDGVHGYRLRAEFTALYGEAYPLSFGRLYRTLTFLEKVGHVTVEYCVQQSKPNRKIYRITEAGRRTLCQWLTTPTKRGERPFGDAISAKLVLVAPSDTDTLAMLVRDHRRTCLERLAHIARRARLLQHAAIDGRISSCILDGAEGRIRADLAWLERMERRIVKEFV